MTDNGYEVVLEDDPNNGIFRLKVQNVPEAVCDKIISADFKLAFNVSACASGDNEVVFSFYDSLNNNVDNTPISDTDSGNTDSPSSGAVSSATQTVTTTPLSSAGNEPTLPPRCQASQYQEYENGVWVNKAVPGCVYCDGDTVREVDDGASKCLNGAYLECSSVGAHVWLSRETPAGKKCVGDALVDE